MKILLDTNVILDALLLRKPFDDDAVKILHLCSTNKIKGFIAIHSFATIFYVMREKQKIQETDCRNAIRYLCKICDVPQSDKSTVEKAINNTCFSDFEDALQNISAENIPADYIVTRNKKDFSAASLKAVLPQEFLQLYKETQ